MSATRPVRVLLTRSADDNADWARDLRARGFDPIECACLQVVALTPGVDVARELATADWVSCTSRRAVDALHAIVPKLPDRVRIAAVGPATEERTRERYGRCDAISRTGNAADLGTELVRLGAKQTLVIAARGGLDDIERTLHAAGRSAKRVELYETLPVDGPLPVAAREADAAFFTSPTAVRALAARGTLPASCALISLGPTTSDALRALGLSVHAESLTRDLDGMLTALATLSTTGR